MALVLTLIEGLGLRQITARILHELALSVRAAEAVGPAFDRRIDRAIRLNVLVIGEAPGTHIAELPSGGIGRDGKSKHERDRKCGRGVNPRHGLSPCEGVGTAHTPPRLPPQRTLTCSVPAADRLNAPRPSAAEARQSPAQA